jgi:diacylglycerol kinase family enzyme
LASQPDTSASTPFPVVVNRGGGAASRAGEALVEQIQNAFATVGLTADVHAVDGAALTETIKRLAKAHDAIAIGGGDGTQGCAAAILARTGTKHGILPLGTRNNLARQLGIPLHLDGAVQVIAAGHTHAIDLSEVNGESFVNNASIGIYPKLVKFREQGRRRGLPKWLANLPAALRVLRNLGHRRYRLTLDNAAQPVVTPLLFIGNNVYSLDSGKVGVRDAMDDGKLSVFAVAKSTRWGLIGFAIRTLRGKSDPARDFAAIGTCATLTVSTKRRRPIPVALDGEVRKMVTPLNFTIRPGALSVFVPKG